MEKKKLLSISLLVSNRPDTVEKCLKSLDHLRKSIPSELILVDTGCGEKVREIIEPYADKIIEFTWCGDFAKARNAGLKEATGEWFLYLDDDEWFDDTSEIEEFFISGEWKEYGYAFYKQRNYQNMSGDVYSDALVTRMARLYEGVQFVYSIHECFENTKGRIKKFNSFVHHYGYIYKSQKEFFEHSQRNIIPLLEEHRKNPRQLRHNAQLAQEYDATNEYRKSIEISMEGIEQRDVNARYVNSLFANVVMCYFKLYDYKNALSFGKQFLGDIRINELCSAAIHSILCKVNYELGKYEDCLNNLQSYIQAYDKQQKDENYYIQYTSLFLNCFEKKEYSSNIGFGMRAAMALNRPKEAKTLFDKIDYNEKVLFVDYEAVKKTIETYLQKTNEEYGYMIKTMLQNANLAAAVIDMTEEKRKKEPELFKGTAEKWKKFSSYHWYFEYLTFWCDPEWGDAEQYQRIWNQPEHSLPKCVEFGILDMIEETKESIDPTETICNIPFYKWQKAVENVCQALAWKEIQKINEKIQKLNTKCDHLVWWDICYEKRSFRELDGTKELIESEVKEIQISWKNYVENNMNLFEKIYKIELFEDRSLFLPDCCQITLLLQDFLAKEKQKEYPAMVKILKEIREISSDFAIPVKYYLKYIEEQMKLQEAEQQVAKNELQWMAQRILPKIEELIQLHKESEALAVVRQIRQLLPNDLKMIELENRLKVSLK